MFPNHHQYQCLYCFYSSITGHILEMRSFKPPPPSLITTYTTISVSLQAEGRVAPYTTVMTIQQVGRGRMRCGGGILVLHITGLQSSQTTLVARPHPLLYQ